MRKGRPREQRLERRQEQHSAEHADVGPASARDERPADDHDRDRRKQEVIAHAKARLTAETSEQDAYQRRAEAAERIDANGGRPHADARQV